MAAIGRWWGCSPVTNNSVLKGSSIVLGVLGCGDKFSTHASLLGSLSLADLHYLKTDLLEKQGIPPPNFDVFLIHFVNFPHGPFEGEHPVRLQDVQAGPIPPVLDIGWERMQTEKAQVHMECHGTGTPLGDPIEIGGLKSINASRPNRW